MRLAFELHRSSFGELLKEFREYENLSIEDVASKLQVSRGYYRKVENGSAPPFSFNRKERYIALASILKLDLYLLMDRAFEEMTSMRLDLSILSERSKQEILRHYVRQP